MEILNNINYKSFVKRHDMIWNQIPYIWYDAPYLGNGFMGVSVYFDKSNTKMIIETGHTKVFDNRKGDYLDPENLVFTSRLHTGKFLITPIGKIVSVNMRLDLYKACLLGEIITSKGRFTFSCFVLNDTDSFVFEHTDFNEKLNFEYVPSAAISPRVISRIKKGEISADSFLPAKDYTSTSIKNTYSFVQPYFNGGGFSLNYAERNNVFIASLDYSKTDAELDKIGYKHTTETFKNLCSLKCSHFKWWASYFNRSFLSIDDGKFEGFVVIQLYKLASASRSDGMPFDTCGPWLTEDTRWPGAWWNLNVELTVSPLYTLNHIEIASCLKNSIKNGIDDLINNVPEKYRKDCAGLGRSTSDRMFSPIVEPGDTSKSSCNRETGNLTWVLFYCWQEYKITNDKSIAADIVFPLLKRAVQYYLYFLYKGEDGKLHLKSTISPEYPAENSEDINYDLSLLRWGCKTLIELCYELKINDNQKSEWKNVLDNLTEYPYSETDGLYIGKDTPYTQSHRHYSHMLMFYPLHNLNIHNKDDLKLINNSIKFWQSKDEALLGYSQSGATSMNAMLGNGNKALYHLNKLMHGFIMPNTMYEEGGNPVLETPPSAATSITEMVLQSHDNCINFFPAVPNSWHNISFSGLLCYGGFEVSAKYKNKFTEFIVIKSHVGGHCRIKARFENKNLYSDVDIKNTDSDIYEFETKVGETIIISSVKEPVIDCIKIKKKYNNCYGMNKRNIKL